MNIIVVYREVNNMKIGILGCGRIAQKMGDTLLKMGLNSEAYIASRDIKKAQEFLKKYHFSGAYGSYEEMLDNPEIELIYIATVNSCHYEQAKMCLQKGKHVLLEKPMTLRLNEAEALYSLAKEKHLYLSEALWTAYMPSLLVIQTYLKDYFSTITSSYAVFKVNTLYKERVKEKSLGGGALFDLGIYPIAMTLLTCGFDYKKMTIDELVINENGVDEKESISLEYPNFIAKMDIDATFDRVSYLEIQNKNYRLKVSPLECPKTLELYHGETLIKQVDVSPQITGFEYEIMESISQIQKGNIESYSWPREKSLKNLKLMTEIIRF